ncbi:hypothetical protein [Marinibactrum halimedae]|uniref:Uncharacterized protein n=1 Tax=Marinibactrum halimedae TaxID=1444977 RepID=A0AA37TAM0_9GAMM|nr:hypothetical protein [Marinibactrum halimedae]MCD9458980.1 hypothetical protein [Marinibactrum halimedae]GLS26891.1 hypothetical protein GCM10007877_26100 [Marinibactrum halimedae]
MKSDGKLARSLGTLDRKILIKTLEEEIQQLQKKIEALENENTKTLIADRGGLQCALAKRHRIFSALHSPPLKGH